MEEFTPFCLDSQIFSDSLLQVLARSPKTEPFVKDRVYEIVGHIMKEELVKQLQAVNGQLEHKINELETNILTQKNNIQRSSSKSVQKMRSLEEKCYSFQKEIEKYKDKENEYQKIVEENLMKSKEIENLKKEIENSRELYLALEENLERKKTDVLIVEETLKNLQDEYDKKVSQINDLQETQKNLEKSLKKSKSSEQKYQKEISNLAKKCEEYELSLKNKEELLKNQSELLKKTEESLRKEQKLREIDKKNRENEHKSFYAKINELHIKKNVWLKCQKKIQILKMKCEVFSEETVKMKEFVRKCVKENCEETKSQYLILMDEIGERMNKELQILMVSMGKRNAEIRILREEVRIKDEIIEKLEKATSVQVMGNKELQKELKIKRIEIESLKGEIKRNYEDTEKKLVGIESNYRKILSGSKLY